MGNQSLVSPVVPSTQSFTVKMISLPMLFASFVVGIVAAVLFFVDTDRALVVAEMALWTFVSALVLHFGVVRRMERGHGISLLGIFYGILLLTFSLLVRMSILLDRGDAIYLGGALFLLALQALLTRNSLMPKDPNYKT